MRLFPKQTKNTKNLRAEFLHRKWGLTSNESNEALERTHQNLLSMFQERPSEKEPLKVYFEAKLTWENKWRDIWEEKYCEQ